MLQRSFPLAQKFTHQAIADSIAIDYFNLKKMS